MVPFLYFFLNHTQVAGVGVAAHEQAVVAHATSLLVIVPLSCRGAWLYNRNGLVRWDAVRRMGPASVLAAVAGARVAVVLPGELLKVGFGLFLIAVASRLVVGQHPVESESKGGQAQHLVRALIGGAAVGFFSATLGVGGGLLAIAVLLYSLDIPIRKVSGTSLAIIAFTAIAGSLSYVIAGWAQDPSLAGAFTYIHLPTSVALAAGALVTVPLGTRLQQRLPTAKLRWVFAAIFFALGARIISTNLISIFAS